MSREDFYIGETSIKIGEHGFINQPKEIIEHIKYLQTQLQQKENIIKEVREYIEHYETIRGYYEYEEDGYDEYNYEEDLKQELLEILDEGDNNVEI